MTQNKFVKTLSTTGATPVDMPPIQVGDVRIVKVQQSLNPGQKMVVIYDESRTWTIHENMPRHILKRLGFAPKKYFSATFKQVPKGDDQNNPSSILEIGDEVASQSW